VRTSVLVLDVVFFRKSAMMGFADYNSDGKK